MSEEGTRGCRESEGRPGDSAARILRFALIGAGKHARRYAAHLKLDCPGCRLVALARRDATRLAEAEREFGCRAYADYHEMLDREEVDAVIVVAAPACNEEAVRAAVSRECAVLLEKPAAPSLAVGRRLQAICCKAARPVMVAHTLRYNAVVRTLLAHREAIGAIHAAVFTQRFERSPLAWLDEPEQSGGGMILHTGVHSFDLLRYLTGREPETVVCQTTRVHTTRTEDNFVAGIRLDGGAALATVSGSRAAPGRTGYIELAGEGGTLVGDHVQHWARLVIGAESRELALGEPLPTVREILHDFCRVLCEGAPVAVPLSEGLRAVAVAEACYAALRSGGVVRVEALD